VADRLLFILNVIDEVLIFVSFLMNLKGVASFGISLAIFDELFIVERSSNLKGNLISFDIKMFDDYYLRFLTILADHEAGYHHDQVVLNHLVLGEHFLINNQTTF